MTEHPSITLNKSLSIEAQEVLYGLGNFSIISDCTMIKGYGSFGDDEIGKTYFGVDDMRKYARGLNEVADAIEKYHTSARDTVGS